VVVHEAWKPKWQGNQQYRREHENMDKEPDAVVPDSISAVFITATDKQPNVLYRKLPGECYFSLPHATIETRRKDANYDCHDKRDRTKNKEEEGWQHNATQSFPLRHIRNRF